MSNDISGINLSITLGPNEMRDLRPRLDKWDLTLREMMDDTASTGLVIKACKPWREANSKLFYEFLESIQAHTAEPQIFNTIADFIQYCEDTLHIMRDMQSKVETKDLYFEEVDLESERNTWRLVFCLYQNRMNNADYSTEMDADGEGNRYISEKVIVDNLFRTEKLIREYQLIIDWLEKNALDQTDKEPLIEHFTDKTVSWENTLHLLQSRGAGITFGSSRPTVNYLDPDAPLREGKPLHDLDKDDDARLERRMFMEVRCGRLSKAQSLAIHCGQRWRAASLLGWVPHHDPNYLNNAVDTKLPIEGNPHRDIWKHTAWELSQDQRLGIYYRAIYASVCGNLRVLLSVSSTWQDALWAHMKTMLDIKVEQEMRDALPKCHVGMPEEYWKNDRTLEEIFTELHASKNSTIQLEASRPYQLIQKYLILDQISELMSEIENMMELDQCDAQFYRFAAHLVLFLRKIGKSVKDKIGDRILLAYVRVLMDIADPILVAFYTATLPQNDQVTIYASYLENIEELELRKKCLSAAEEANLNIEEITKLVVENIRQKDVELASQDLKGQITSADLVKINALDWLTFYPNQIEEAIWQGNALIRYFLTNEKIDAARKAFSKIPADLVDMIVAEQPENMTTLITSETNYSKKLSSSIHEYMCYKTYLDAQEGFTTWFTHFYHEKPAPLESLPSYATFTEKVAHDHKKVQYNTEMDRWKCTMQHYTKAAKQLLFNVLLFPNGGWLTGPCKIKTETLREHQLDKLRKLCIPKIVLLLHTVMSEMNEHAECVALADVIASEDLKLYKVFTKDKMKELLKKISESALALMDQKKDPWGYSKQ